MSDKELTPAEAYQALINGKVIEKNERYFKKIGDSLKYRLEDGPWHTLVNNDAIAGMFLDLSGYRLAKEKKMVRVISYLNYYRGSGGAIYTWAFSSEEMAKLSKSEDSIVTAIKIEKEIEVEV